jgi:hypothetical protein
MSRLAGMRVLGCAALATVATGASFFSAGPAQADEAGYLAQLSQHGYEVTPPSGEYLLGSGHAMCQQLRSGHSPEDVARHWTYPNASYQNLLDMARAAQANLCG